jgi:hypothetical protein
MRVSRAGLSTLRRPWMVLLAGCLSLQGCSQGDTPLVNPGTNRGGLTALPETLRVGLPSADRSFRAEVSTGSLANLRLARQEGRVETIVLILFGTLPETTGVTGAHVGLRLRGGTGAALKIEASWIDSTAASWTESGVRWSNRPAPGSFHPLFVAAGPVDPSDSTTTVFLRDVVEIPSDVIALWKLRPASNRGIALRLSDDSEGSVSVLSREAVLDSSGVANPFLEILQGQAVIAIESATADAYVYNDRRLVAQGTADTLLVTDDLPCRALLRFGRPLNLPSGSTINRAVLRLHLKRAAVDTLSVAANGITIGPSWDESAEPDTSIRTGALYDLRVLPTDVRTPSNTVSFDIAGLARRWFQDGDGGGVQIRSQGELIGQGEVVFYSREAADSTNRPLLDLVYTPPPDPRWGPVEQGRTR